MELRGLFCINIHKLNKENILSIIIFQGEKGLPGSNGGPGPNGPIGDPGRTGKSGKRGPSGGMVNYDFSLFIIIFFFFFFFTKLLKML